MRQAARRIAAGEYQERVTYKGPGEMTDLATDFNTMAQSLASAELQRSELIRNLAHEARTPLMNLGGYIEALEDGVFILNKETLIAIKRQLTRLERLMNDLSLLSRVEARQESVKPEKADLDTILKASTTPLQPQFESKKVALKLEPSLTKLLVFADPIRTEQILSNLLTNALRHTPKGGQVKVWLEQEVKQIIIHVEDTGEGIKAEDLPHIFKRFYRGGSERDDTTGSGIGLTIAEYFVKAQGGTIHVESSEGKGSHFWFSLPQG
jgi:histidine kinase